MDDAIAPITPLDAHPMHEPHLSLHTSDALDECCASGAGEAEALPTGDDAPEPLEQARIIEALLFAADAPLTAAKLGGVVGLTPGGVVRSIALLNERYAAAELTFRIEKIARGYQMLTLPEYQAHVQKLHQNANETRLTPAALETLAVIAYRQPVMRADIEAVRGVAVGDQVNRLREVGLVKIVGRAEVVGRPLLFGTTKKFLDVFGLGDLKDLPPLEEFGLAAPVSKPVEEVAPRSEQAENPAPVAGDADAADVADRRDMTLMPDLGTPLAAAGA